MKSLVPFLIFSFLLTSFAIAQDLKVPSPSVFKSESDYDKYLPEVKASMDWVINTPLGTEKRTRKDANAFLMKWMEGTSATSISLGPDVMTWIDNNPDLLMVFMSGWASYELGHGKDAEKAKNSGLKSVLEAYSNAKSKKKDPDLEKLLKKVKKGKLKL